MILYELTEPIPVETIHGKGRAAFMVYLNEDYTEFRVWLNKDGSFWWVQQRDLRITANLTNHRPMVSPIAPSTPTPPLTPS